MSARWMVVAGLALSLAACGRTHPQVEPDLPPLAAPTPPPRVLPPLEGGPIEGAVTATDEEQPPASPRPAPRRRAEVARPAEPPRTEPAPVPPAEPPAAEAAPPAEAPVLQLTPPGEEARIEQAIRQQLARAKRDLGNVDYRALSVDARAQYDTAQRFTVLAEQAIKDRNLIFAQTLADKAAAIAAVLVRR